MSSSPFWVFHHVGGEDTAATACSAALATGSTASLARRRFGIKKGTLITFVEDNGRIIVQPVTREFIRGLRGSLKGEPSALRGLLGERKRERTL